MSGITRVVACALVACMVTELIVDFARQRIAAKKKNVWWRGVVIL